MKIRYAGTSFGADSLTNGREYECLGIEGEFYRVIDDSGEDYLYPIENPASLSGGDGKWIVVDSGRHLREYSKAV
jgi:hypothetical protein